MYLNGPNPELTTADAGKYMEQLFFPADGNTQVLHVLNKKWSRIRKVVARTKLYLKDKRKDAPWGGSWPAKRAK